MSFEQFCSGGGGKGFTINQSFILLTHSPVPIAHYSVVRLHFNVSLRIIISVYTPLFRSCMTRIGP